MTNILFLINKILILIPFFLLIILCWGSIKTLYRHSIYRSWINWGTDLQKKESSQINRSDIFIKYLISKCKETYEVLNRLYLIECIRPSFIRDILHLCKQNKYQRASHPYRFIFGFNSKRFCIYLSDLQKHCS